MISVQKICMHIHLCATSSVNCEINTTFTLNTEKDVSKVRSLIEENLTTT